jgi:hypothetical protein
VLESFGEYLTDMGVTGPMRQRLDEIAIWLPHLGLPTVDALFLTQGSGVYMPGTTASPVNLPPVDASQPPPVTTSAQAYPITGVWFFGEGLAMEVGDFMSDAYKIDQVSLRNSVTRWEMQPHRFHPGRSAPDSWLSVAFSSWDNIGGTLLAIGANCEVLFEIFRSRIQPNLRRSS